VEVYLLLKGGGCENVSTQYSLPDPAVGAHRDLTGCKKVVLDAIVRAQGKGCAPGVIGVCIGGDRAMGYKMAKRQLLRRLDDINPDPQLARFEEEVFELANSLGIGPMGFGGRTTLLGVKACTVARVPASFFVTVSYMCWAFRRRGVIFKITGELVDWI
jgi:fumarate hydratase class I